MEGDHLDLALDSKFCRILELQETLLFSANIEKVNRRNKSQSRILAITSLAVYNLKKTKLQRRIPLPLLIGLTYSSISDEFVLHVPSEYDYYLKSQRRDEAVRCLLLHSGFPFYIWKVAEESLALFVTQKSDRKKNVSHLPEVRLAEYRRTVVPPWAILASPANTRQIYPVSEVGMSLSDFEITSLLANSHSGDVFRVRLKNTNLALALKVTQGQPLCERLIKERNESPFFPKVQIALEIDSFLFMFVEVIEGKTLPAVLSGPLPEDKVRWLAAELVLALGKMHEYNQVYSDLQAKNVVLTDSGHVCVTDFGVKRSRTPEVGRYTAPEVMVGGSMVADWWSLGVIVREMMVGDCNRNLETHRAEMLSAFLLSPAAKDFVEQLTNPGVEWRLGFWGVKQVQVHPFLKNVDWQHVAAPFSAYPLA